MKQVNLAQGVPLDSLIAPVFWPVHWAMMDEAADEIWLKGGRGSGKSSALSIEIVRGLIEHPDASAVIYRKVADTLRDSVHAQILWAIEKLGLSDVFTSKVSPMEISRPDTGQRILFRGADDPQRGKGVTLANGYFRYLWFEELAEFDSMDDIRTIQASVLRGSEEHSFTLYSYNPPMSAQNWVNGEALIPVNGRLVHQSCYLDMPSAWLGKKFIQRANALKATNERAYRHMYLGEVTGTGGQVFDNLVLRSIKPEEWQGLHTYSGLDFGFASDPDTFVRCAYDRKRRRLYVVSEFAATGQMIAALAAEVRKRCGHDVTTCDSAEPRSIEQLRRLGLRVVGAKKGPDSIDHGMKWLQTLGSIIIDPALCPFAAKEFSQYEYERDKSGGIIPRYPDKDNHTIDAVRYAMESVSGMKAAVVPQ